MDWSKITSSAHLTDKVLAQAACTREDAYALLDLIQKFNAPSRIEKQLIHLFKLVAMQSWIGNRLTVEIIFRFLDKMNAQNDCRIRLLTPVGDGNLVVLKQVLVKVKYASFVQAVRDRRGLAPFVLDDSTKGKILLKADRSMSIVPPDPEQARKKVNARLAKAGFEFRSMPPDMKRALETMKRASPGRAKATVQAKAPRPIQIPKQAPLPSDLTAIDYGWDEEEGPTLPKPRK